jgi:hypothetical protein
MRTPTSVNGASLCVNAQPLCVKIALMLTDASTAGILNQRIKLLKYIACGAWHGGECVISNMGQVIHKYYSVWEHLRATQTS